MGNPISAKTDLVVSHIEQLPDGAKVSVRELAAQLSVSEGTAYKAVKEAERLGLVSVKPKAGTVRVSVSPPKFERSVPAADLVRLLGLGVAAGRTHLSRHIQNLVLCDGSVENLHTQLLGQTAEECLCLCGDRPDIQAAVLSAGANLLLTAGTRPIASLLNLAEKKELLLLTSLQNTFSLSRQFDALFSGWLDVPDKNTVSAWMQTPDFLYSDDIVADWQRLYRESSMAQQYPVVGDNLVLCGGLDIWAAAAAIPSQKILSMVDSRKQFLTFSSRDSLSDAAKQMILNNASLAAVVDGGRLQGILNSNDLLRYYMYAGPERADSGAEALLARDETVSDGEKTVFHVRVPEAGQSPAPHIEARLILSAVSSVLHSTGSGNYHLVSGTFFSHRRAVQSESLLLMCTVQRGADGTLSVDAELSDDNESYAKAMLIAAPQL